MVTKVKKTQKSQKKAVSRKPKKTQRKAVKKKTVGKKTKGEDSWFPVVPPTIIPAATVETMPITEPSYTIYQWSVVDDEGLTKEEKNGIAYNKTNKEPTPILKKLKQIDKGLLAILGAVATLGLMGLAYLLYSYLGA
jgi:hypothetical protein